MWITPDGKVFRKRWDVWTVAIPSDVGIEGVAGVLFKNSPLSVKTAGYRLGGEQLPAGGFGLVRDPYVRVLLSDALTENANTEFSWIDSRSAGSLKWNMYHGANLPSDFVTLLESDLGLALRDAEGNTIWRNKTSGDTDEPYEWFKAGDAASTASVSELRSFLTRTGAGDIELVLYRPSLRCEGDPLSPWTPEPDFAGVAGEPATAKPWRTCPPPATPVQAAPTIFTWTSTDSDPFATIALSGDWSLARPAAPTGNDVIWCSAATLSSADSDKSVVGSSTRDMRASGSKRRGRGRDLSQVANRSGGRARTERRRSSVLVRQPAERHYAAVGIRGAQAARRNAILRLGNAVQGRQG